MSSAQPEEAIVAAPEITPMNIATISAGFEKGDFLVREEQGNRVYFDFFEEAFNYISNKGYARMTREDEKHWVDLMNVIHDSVKGGMKYNTGTLLMVLSRPVDKPEGVEKVEKVKAKVPVKAETKQNP
uniref:Uncharacterized protein n=1 Tax=Craspedostauros australis TaxID=1486917 RepID=A0A7S0F7F4_9STRA|mmetsp:Transcript_9836/g.26844  ORF Transcript_9836/g.26844 Transcript_9836/m.26844 type:complete len:128 (+) Transcript_9836:162-545(+)